MAQVALKAAVDATFPIPMRGNESTIIASGALVGDSFPIPMRGNESSCWPPAVSTSVPVSDPHEG